jgi:hypothetical protein
MNLKDELLIQLKRAKNSNLNTSTKYSKIEHNDLIKFSQINKNSNDNLLFCWIT